MNFRAGGRPHRQGPDSRPRILPGRRAAAPLLLALLALVPFLGLLEAGFIALDDPEYVLDNARVRGGLTAASALWALTATHAANWHPATWLSHMLDVELSGLAPRGHHLTSLLLHAAAALLLYAALRGMTGAGWRSAWVAALFAAHPLRVESVAWVAQRKDVLAGFLWMLSLLAYLRYVRRPRGGRYLALALVFAVGLAAKSTLVTLPFVLLLLDWWPLGRLGSPLAARLPGARAAAGAARLIAEKLPLLALSAAAAALTYQAQRAGGSLGDIMGLPLWRRLANAALSYGTYAWQLLLPADLGIYYSFTLHVPSWKVAAAATFVLGGTALALARARRQGYLCTGWFWYLGTLVPMIGIVQVGAQAHADRYTYLPQIGLLLALAWGVPALAGATGRQARALPLAGAAALLPLAALTQRQADLWRDEIGLYEHTLRVAPDDSLLRHALGCALEARGRAEEALAQYRRAVALNPRHASAHSNIGAIFARQGRSAEALAGFSRALEIDPGHYEARVNLAALLAATGRPGEAAAHYREALRVRPGDRRARRALARLGAAAPGERR